MATVEELLAAIKHIQDCTSDPKAWLTGLTPQELADAATVFATPPHRLDALVAKLRRQHPDLFDPSTGAMVFPPAHRPGGPPGDIPPTDQQPDRQQGDAADAIRIAEAALAQQDSATSQLDLQMIAAILNAHVKAVEGKEALNELQRDIESAVRARTELDTATGARDFQRYLVGKLKDIRAVVASGNLDDTSKAALMAALTSLYNASEGTRPDPAGSDTPATGGTAAPSGSDGEETAITPDTDLDAYSDYPPTADLDGLTAVSPAPAPAATTAPAMSALPAMGGVPNLSGSGLPGAAMPSWSPLAGSGVPGLFEDAGRRRSPEDDDIAGDFDDPVPDDRPTADDGEEGGTPDTSEEQPAQPDAQVGPTMVALPNGETVTAASPQLAAAIEAAVAGTPIADAFRQQGMTIPPPGTAVPDPVDPAGLAPGDIGMFTDRHALALGNSQTFLNGQIQHLSTVQGPSFLGWEHPPAPTVTSAPMKTDPPTPTRPAAVVGTS